MTRRSAALVCLVLLASACGGPERKLDVGFKEVPSNVVLGAQTKPTPGASRGPVLVPLPPPPGVVSLPPPPFVIPPPNAPEPPPPLPSVEACPAADPLAPPKVEAPARISAPPSPAAYIFANVGTFSVSGVDARKGTFPERTVRVVSNVRRFSEGTFSYDVAERIGDVTTTTTYRVANEVPAPFDAVPPGPGIFLDRVTYRAGAEETSFAPTNPPMIAALPLVRGATIEQRAVDPRPDTQTVMTFTSTVEGKQRVVACGEPLDSWTIHLTKGTITSLTQELEFDATYQVATQFGGIVISDAIAYAGTDGDAGIERSNRAVITQVPR